MWQCPSMDITAMIKPPPRLFIIPPLTPPLQVTSPPPTQNLLAHSSRKPLTLLLSTWLPEMDPWHLNHPLTSNSSSPPSRTHSLALIPPPRTSSLSLQSNHGAAKPLRPRSWATIRREFTTNLFPPPGPSNPLPPP